MDEAFEAALDRGIERFNSLEFWNAHEEWEHIWLKERGERRDFLQGLIQLAAAWYHVQRENWRGASRLFAASLGRLDRFPPDYCGVDRDAATALARSARATLERGDPLSSQYVAITRSGRDFRKSEI